MTQTKITFGKPVGFRKELNRRVEAFFAAENIPQRDCPEMYLKAAILFLWIFGTWLAILFIPAAAPIKLLGCIFLAFGMAGFMFNIGHDAIHEGFSNNKYVNYCLGLTYDFMGVSSYLWRYRHNTLHHTYTNIPHHDVEIDGDGWVRMYVSQEHRWFHRFQHIYIWLIYSIVPLYWSYGDVELTLKKGKYHDHPIPTMKLSEKLTLLGFKVLWLGYAIGLPLAIGYTPLEVLVGFLVTYVTYGVILNIVFMMAHVVEKAEFILPDPETGAIDEEWAIFQIKTTVDFAQDNALINWYVGGLNYQVVHHLFPQICHIHYPKIAKILQEVCDEFGVEYKIYDTFREVLASNYRWIKSLGTASSQPATPQSQPAAPQLEMVTK